MTRIALTGALGRMGTLIIQEAAKQEGLELVAGLDVVGAGKELPGGVLVRDASELEAALRETRTDVLIDFTIAQAAVENVCIAARLGVDLVVGAGFFPGDGETRVTLQLAGHRTLTDVSVLDRTEFYVMTGEIEHPFAHGRWRADLRFMAGLGERDLYLNPRLTYTGIDQHELFVAAHVFSGSEQTLGGYYSRNDSVMVGWQAKF